MIRYWIIAAMLIIGGRALSQSSATDSVTNAVATIERGTDNRREVPMEVILNIPSRVKSLKVGMSKKDVLAILGLTGYSPIVIVSGPMTMYGHSYYLRTNYVLTVTFDETKDSFRSVRLDGDGWKKTTQ